MDRSIVVYNAADKNASLSMITKRLLVLRLLVGEWFPRPGDTLVHIQ